MAEDRGSRKDPERGARLSEALRRNLLRRKRQARGRGRETGAERDRPAERPRGERG